METRGTTGEETISYWFDLPIDVAEFEEKLGVGAESQDYRIIEKVLPFADEVHEHTSVYQLNELDFMYRQLPADMQEEYVSLARNDLEQRITYYLEKTSLTEHQNKKMRQLSGGMKRRVGLIQALLNNPDFLIIDEPTTGLDPEERIRIRNLLVDFSKDRTVLFSTHVVEDLAATCTQLAIMKKGNFLYSGSVSGLLENAKGCVWNCTVQNAEEARLLEANYSISSKQYVENGIHMKILSKGKPNEKCVPDNDITLEDAYIYLTNS